MKPYFLTSFSGTPQRERPAVLPCDSAFEQSAGLLEHIHLHGYLRDSAPAATAGADGRLIQLIISDMIMGIFD